MQELLGQSPYMLLSRSEQPAEHTLDVAIHDRRRLIEGDAADGRRSVTADPRQSRKLLGGSRKSAVLNELPGGGVQRTGAPVVSQAAPGREYFRQLCSCQPLHTRKARQKARVAIPHHGHPCLLQHDFRDPDVIRITVGAPGEPAAVAVEPTEKPAAKGAPVIRLQDRFWRFHGAGAYCIVRIGRQCGPLARVSLCAIATQLFVTCCHTVIMRMGSEGSGWPLYVPRTCAV